jgi:hypothetical protein
MVALRVTVHSTSLVAYFLRGAVDGEVIAREALGADPGGGAARRSLRNREGDREPARAFGAGRAPAAEVVAADNAEVGTGRGRSSAMAPFSATRHSTRSGNPALCRSIV